MTQVSLFFTNKLILGITIFFGMFVFVSFIIYTTTPDACFHIIIPEGMDVSCWQKPFGDYFLISSVGFGIFLFIIFLIKKIKL